MVRYGILHHILKSICDVERSKFSYISRSHSSDSSIITSPRSGDYKPSGNVYFRLSRAIYLKGLRGGLIEYTIAARLYPRKRNDSRDREKIKKGETLDGGLLYLTRN